MAATTNDHRAVPVTTNARYSGFEPPLTMSRMTTRIRAPATGFATE